MGARVYDPYTGTFTEPDPIPGADANSYGYSNGDPVNETDLSGDMAGPHPACMAHGHDACPSVPILPSTTTLLTIGAFVPIPGLEEVDDATLLARGGENTAERFAGGSGVTTDGAGNLHGVSVNSGDSVDEASKGIPNGQVGVSTAGDVRSAGGYVTRDPLPGNPGHCLIGGCTSDTFSELFRPTIRNPSK